MKWRDHFYVDLALPFSLRSAPFIFNNVAVMLECILRNNYGIQAFASDFTFLLPPKNALAQNVHHIHGNRVGFDRVMRAPTQ